MRKMGIDYGHKKVGIALSDEGGLMAFPHDVWPNDSELLKKIGSLVEEKDVAEIVIGHSLSKTGEANKIHTQAEALITDLTLHLGLPVHLEPEQYTTQQAIRFQGRTDKTDAAAAAIILDSYITRKK
ncbi:Holliday junction resolvase RuvX [bacterium]|nr:Holliday junction resolvase RuvX [bacterium]